MFLSDVLLRKKAHRIPVWMMRQAGRYLPEYRKLRSERSSFLELCYNPELACQVTLQPITRFDFDAAILFSDILVVPHALGCSLHFSPEQGPVLDPIRGASDLSRLQQNAFLERLGPVFETLSLVRSRLSGEKDLIGFCGAPWTLATYMVAGGSENEQISARTWAYADPVSFAELIEILTECSISYLEAQIRAGANVLQIFDSWAGTLPEKEWQRWSAEPISKIVTSVKKTFPSVPILVFSRGAESVYTDLIKHCPVDALSLDASVPFSFIREKIQPFVAVQGNLDPLLLQVGGKALDQSVDEILENLATGPFVFGLGHGIRPGTPVEHVSRVVQKVREWTSP